MRKRLEEGTLWWLLKQMPPVLKNKLNDELDQLDTLRREAHKKGQTRITSMAMHLRWVAEDRADLGEMKVLLFGVLVNYLPLTVEHMCSNRLPNLSDCSYFWGRQIKQLERAATESQPVTA